MKNIFIIPLLGILVIFGSCEFNDGDERPVEVTPKFGVATINIVMAVTTANDMDPEGVDVWIDEVLQGEQMSAGDVVSVQHEFPQGSYFRSVLGGEFPKYIDNPIASVENNLAHATAAEMLPADHNTPLQGQLKDGGSYTLVVYGFGALNHDYEHLFMVEDDLTAPSSGNAKIRFLNAAGGECWDNTCEIEFEIGGTSYGSGIWGGDVFGAGLTAFTDFTEIAPGTLTVDSFDGDAAAYFSDDVTVEAGGIYTIVISGNETNGELAVAEPIKYTVIEH